MATFNFNGIKVSGISTVVPKQVVPTESYKETFGGDEVDKFMKMTGIRQTRRTHKYQTASDMAYTAAQRLLEHKGIDPSEIKALVFGTHSPDYRRPASAFVVQKRLGLSTEAAVFDISGSLYRPIVRVDRQPQSHDGRGRAKETCQRYCKFRGRHVWFGAKR